MVEQLFHLRDEEGEHVHTSAATVRTALIEEYSIEVSLRTVERDLVELGNNYRKRPVTAELNTDRMSKRLEMIPVMREVASRRKIAFSDESICLATDTRTHQWVRPGEEPAPIRRARWAARIHLWGCIGEDFKVLFFFDNKQNVNAEIYQEMLKKNLFKRAEWKSNNFVLMQDGAPAHRAASTKEFLAAHNVELLPWPPHSPDLNPIENLWAIIKRKLRVTCFTKQDELENEINRVWDAIPMKTVNRLVNSFPKRLDKCEENGGDDCEL